jgi:chlorobactene glucosyltransferase
MTLVVGVISVQLAIFVLLIRNRMTFRPLAELQSPTPDTKPLKVSLLIPARNEERIIEQVVMASLNQDFRNVEVIVLNDHSDDDTGTILDRLSSMHGPRLRVIHGKERPIGWLGKPWACQQLGEAAAGDLFIFIDADTIPSPSLASSAASDFSTNGAGLTTVWPEQILVGTWEKIIVPLVYYTLLGFLVTDYTRRDPRWMPKPLRSLFRPLFAAACGQCLAMPASLYRDIGGHSLVKADVVEDVGIARKVRSLGLPVRMYHGIETIRCRMYTSHSEIFNGFRKNFLAGFGGNTALFVLSAVLHLVLFVLPPIALVINLAASNYNASILWLVAVLIPILQRLVLNHWMRWEMWTSITHLVGVLWFQYLGLVVLADKLFGRKVTWKGRNVG